MINQNNRDLAEVMRDEMIMKERILSRLREEPATIPEIATVLEHPSVDVMLWIMAMWRYGIVEEVGKPDNEGFYKYRPVK
nr:MarR family transcriptional regulator [candidate division Zixibacteria bacterium]